MNELTRWGTDTVKLSIMTAITLLAFAAEVRPGAWLGTAVSFVFAVSMIVIGTYRDSKKDHA